MMIGDPDKSVKHTKKQLLTVLTFGCQNAYPWEGDIRTASHLNILTKRAENDRPSSDL
jgi:hypothetical protein